MSDKSTTKPAIVPITKDIRTYMMPSGKDERNEVPVNFRIPASLARRVEIMLADARGKLPWKTATDFYRWATWESVKRAGVELESSKLTSFCKQYEAELTVLREAEMKEKVLGLFDQVKRHVEGLERLGAWDEIPRFLRKAFAPLEEMEHENYYTRRLVKEFKKEYGERMNQRKLSLKPKDAEESE